MSQAIFGLIIPALAGIFALVFAGLWWRDRETRYILGFVLGYATLGLGFLIFHFTPEPDALLPILAMHGVYSVAVCSFAWASCRRADQAAPMPRLVAICVIGGVMIAYASVGDDMNARLIAANSCYGLVLALVTQALARKQSPEIIDRAIVWLFALTSLQFFVRPFVAVMANGAMSAAVYRSSQFYSLLILLIAVISLLLAIVLVAAVAADQWRKASRASEFDHLTGLKMRRAFESEAMVALDENLDRRIPMSLIVADIDLFKQVNDLFGHQAGDEVIASFGRLIGGTVRETDICGRIGGEEFCILVWNCDLPSARNLAERIRRKFADVEHAALDGDRRLTASFGIAQWRSGEGYGKLFARADKALYRAKDRGRDQVECEGAAILVDAEESAFDTNQGGATSAA